MAGPAGCPDSRSPVQAHDRRRHRRRPDCRRAGWTSVPAVRHPSAGGDTIAAALREVAADDSVSAIVLRVDSPGGSVTASETIWREVTRARERGKPVVVSMGAVAASGGYYISMAADAIVANPGDDHRFDRGDHRQAGGSRSEGPVGRRVGYRSHQRQCRCLVDRPPFTPEQQAQPEAEADLCYSRLCGTCRRGPQYEYRSRGCRCARPGLDRCRRSRARSGRRTRRAANRAAPRQGR